jgi:hypothetical protein
MIGHGRWRIGWKRLGRKHGDLGLPIVLAKRLGNGDAGGAGPDDYDA